MNLHQSFKNRKREFCDVDTLSTNSQKILSKCISSQTNSPNNQTGLLFGKIQSGKTLNYISLITLAFDRNYYDIVIVLSGVDLEINKQTTSRIREEFRHLDNSTCLIKVIPSESLPLEKSQINTIDWKTSKNEEKIIFTVLKNHKHLDWLLSTFQDGPLINKNVLIIDDEADLASLDGNKNTRRTYSTTINLQINKLRNILGKYSYLSVTATPYAPLLLSLKDSLSPSFIKLLEPGKGYFGLTNLVQQNKNYFYPIDEIEMQNINDLWKTPPLILQKAISTFIFSSIIFKNRYKLKFNLGTKMLIHTDFKLVPQKRLYSNIKDWLDILQIRAKKYQKNPNSPDSIELYKFLQLGAIILQPSNSPIDFNSFLPDLIEHVAYFLEVIIINSDKTVEKFRNADNNYSSGSQIIIGAKLLERGITYENLLTTFITRRAKNKSLIDTTLQRARWFGYRTEYQDLIKVFLIGQIKNDFLTICNTENLLWISLQKIEQEEIPNSDWDILIVNNLSTELDVTSRRRVKIKKWQTPLNTFQGFLSPVSNKELDLINFWKQKVRPKNYDQVTHHELIANNFLELKSIFLNDTKNIIFLLKEKLQIYKEAVKSQILENLLSKKVSFKIVLMRNWNKERKLRCRHEHDGDDNCQNILAYMGAFPGGGYPGDFYLSRGYLENRGIILLQVHKVTINCKTKGTIKNCYFYALQFPKTMKRITGFVRDD